MRFEFDMTHCRYVIESDQYQWLLKTISRNEDGSLKMTYDKKLEKDVFVENTLGYYPTIRYLLRALPETVARRLSNEEVYQHIPELKSAVLALEDQLAEYFNVLPPKLQRMDTEAEKEIVEKKKKKREDMTTRKLAKGKER